MIAAAGLLCALLAQGGEPYHEYGVPVQMQESYAATLDDESLIPPARRYGPLGTNWYPRFGIAHQTEGYGYEDSFTTFEGYVPLWESPWFSLTAFEGDFLIDNQGEIGFNAGFIHRHYFEEANRTLGGSLYWDNRNTGRHTFNQIGIGIESLGENLDFRSNVYLPIGNDRGLNSTTFQGAQFMGTSLLLNRQRSYDAAMTGIDMEVGGPLPIVRDVLKAYIGWYYFHADASDSALGAQGRLEFRYNDNLTMQLALQHDDVFDSHIMFGLAMNFPGYRPRTTESPGSVWNRIAERVQRNRAITVDRQLIRDQIAALDANGAPITVVHVNSAAAGGGDGSLEMPFMTLAEAQAGSNPGNIIFAHANSRFIGETIALQDDQQFLGEGIPQIISTDTRVFELPTVTPSGDQMDVPAIVASPIDAVTLADNNTVSGFQIVGAGENGVRGDGINGFRIDRNVIEDAGNDGISILNLSGTGSITGNMLNDNIISAATLTTSGTAVSNVRIAGNSIDNTATHVDRRKGIIVRTFNQADQTLIIENNTLQTILMPPTPIGLPPIDLSLIEVVTTNSSQLRARIENNLLRDEGFDADGDFNSQELQFAQLRLQVQQNSEAFVGIINNQFVSNRNIEIDGARTASFGVDASTSQISLLGLRLQNNTSDLGYAFRELDLSEFQLEDTLDTNTGEILTMPPRLDLFEIVPRNTFPIP